MAILNIDKNFINKEDLFKIINNKFSQFSIEDNLNENISIEDFFKIYEDIFYVIPKEGDQSHRYILNKTSEYLGIQINNEEINIQSLLDEITSLRQELFNTKNSLING